MPDLRTTLFVNAAFSAITGAALVLMGWRLSAWLGVPLWFAVALGAGLVGFAAVVHRAAQTGDRLVARLILAADVAWVVGTLAVILVVPGVLSPAGRWFFAVVGLIVADFAVLEWLGLRRTGDRAADMALRP